MTDQSEPHSNSKIEPLPTWTEQECWVWNQVCVGEVADFNRADGYGGELDPRKPDGWMENRRLRQEFLEAILLQDPFRSALTRNGVRVVGAWFKEQLDLSSATVSHQLWLDSCRSEADVNLSHLHTTSLISMEGSKFTGKVDMNSLHVEGSLFMRNGAEFAEVNLGNATVKGQIDMTGSKFTGAVNLNSLQVDGSLFMRNGAEFIEVDLRGANVGSNLEMDGSRFTGRVNMNSLQVDGSLFMRNGAEFIEVDLGNATVKVQVDMTGSKFTGAVNLNSLQVDGSLFMRNGAEFAEVNLVAANISKQIDMGGSKFTSKLNMYNLHVEGSLFMRNGAEFAEVNLGSANVGSNLEMDGSRFTGKLKMESLHVEGNLFMRNTTVSATIPFSLIYSKIGTSLDLSGSALPSLDLTGTAVRGEFRLGQVDLPAKWHSGAKLTLRNTEVGALQDLPKAWPDELELEGFTYSRLGGFQADSTTDMATQPISWLREWLARQRKYSPQPYEQLASVLLKSGRKDKANEILYAGRERERKEGTLRDWLWLTLHKMFIGYGYRMHYAIAWVVGFVFLGGLVLRISGEDVAKQVGIAYSFDMLLPLVKLSEQHSKIELDGWVRYYFYFHKLMGYVLGSFVVGGLSGLAKK